MDAKRGNYPDTFTSCLAKRMLRQDLQDASSVAKLRQKAEAVTFPVKVLACALDELSVTHQGERDLTSSCENTMNCAVLGTAAGYTYVVKTKRLSASLVTCLCLYFCDG